MDVTIYGSLMLPRVLVYGACVVSVGAYCPRVHYCAQWALQDLDNLQCDTTGNGHCGDAVDFQGRPNGPEHTTAELTLKNMLIYGQCFDAKLGNYAHGLQVTVRTVQQETPCCRMPEG